jgi:PhoPQ-activated pathogenicity-related protein
MLIMQQDTNTPLDEATAYVVDLLPGQKAVIPQNWHYTLVNTGKETLATIEMYQDKQELNQCAADKKGTGIYIIERNGMPEIVKNSQYKNLSKYATVSAERYGTCNNLSTTETLINQAPSLASAIPAILACNWASIFKESGTGNFPF